MHDPCIVGARVRDGADSAGWRADGVSLGCGERGIGMCGDGATQAKGQSDASDEKLCASLGRQQRVAHGFHRSSDIVADFRFAFVIPSETGLSV